MDATNVGDECGFAPNILENKEGLELLKTAIAKAGYTGKVVIGGGGKRNRGEPVGYGVGTPAIGVSLNSKDEEGRKALHMASANGNVDIVNYLISNNVEHMKFVPFSHVRTPVDEAAIGGKMDVIDAINTTVAQTELTRTNIVQFWLVVFDFRQC
ncbi:hypothetical protein LXL04_027739 [Taraxacum kok-saghyz]